MHVRPMPRKDISSVADLRLRLLSDLGVAGREGVGRLWLHATPGGRGIYEAAGFEGRSVEEMQLVLSG